MDFKNDLSVKSFCFREFKDAATLAKMVRDCGVTALDISRCHIDFSSIASQESLLSTLDSEGVRVVGLGVVPLTGEASDRQYFDFCKLAGCRTISVNFEPKQQAAVLASIGKLCDEYAMRCAVHNHGGHHWLGNKQMLDHLFTQTPLGLCLDTAWALDAGEDPVAWAKAAGPRLIATHLKDFTFDAKGHPTDVVLGRGGLDLPAYLATLRDLNFDGPLAVEYEGDAHDPVPALAECVRIVKSLL